MSDNDDPEERWTRPDDPQQRRDSRRMMALDSAIRCRREFSTADDVLTDASKFLAFLEGKLVAVLPGEPS